MNSQRFLGSLDNSINKNAIHGCFTQEISSTILLDTSVSGNQTTSQARQQLQEALGETTCTNSIIARSVEFFSLAIMATLVYIFLQLPPVEAWFERYIPDFEYRLISKAILFFVIVYILDRLVVFIRNEIDICDFRDF